MDLLLGHLGHGMGLILMLAMPAVLLAAGIGLIVGILQAVTQVQEQTIAAAPKIFFVFMLVIFGGPFMVDVLRGYLIEAIHLGLEVVPKDDNMILPPKPRLAYGEENARMEFFKEKRRRPEENKIKRLMENPSKASTFNEMVVGKQVGAQKPMPKPGVGEQIYLKRRAAGKLPNPPDRRN
jgi:flagellar biosynthesis protein FliQ